MGGVSTKVALGLVLAAMAVSGAGCSSPPPRQSDALARSRAFLDKLDRLEAELHAQSTDLVVHEELAIRRQSVSEVACQIAGSHAKDMARLSEKQKRKRQEKARRLALLRNDGAMHVNRP